MKSDEVIDWNSRFPPVLRAVFLAEAHGGRVKGAASQRTGSSLRGRAGQDITLVNKLSVPYVLQPGTTSRKLPELSKIASQVGDTAFNTKPEGIFHTRS